MHEAFGDRPTIPLPVGAFVRYQHTPVGPYGEILAAPVLLAEAPLPPACVPFVAVDSIASLRDRQPGTGLIDIRATGRAQLATVELNATGPELPRWLLRARIPPSSSATRG